MIWRCGLWLLVCLLWLPGCGGSQSPHYTIKKTATGSRVVIHLQGGESLPVDINITGIQSADMRIKALSAEGKAAEVKYRYEAPPPHPWEMESRVRGKLTIEYVKLEGVDIPKK